RRRCTIVLVAMTVITVAGAGRAWLRDTIQAAAGTDKFQESLRDEEARTAELAAQEQALRARVIARRTVLADLIAGRIDLVRAAELFVELNVAYPNYLERLRLLYPDMTDTERVCRNVIEHCIGELAFRPERTAVLARLEEEFAALRSRTEP